MMFLMRFVLKWIINGVIVIGFLMYFADVPFMTAASTATALTIIAYLAGDHIILRSTNNTVATIADAILTLAFFWLVSYWMKWDLSAGEILIMTVILGAAEWCIHRFVFQRKLSVQGS